MTADPARSSAGTVGGLAADRPSRSRRPTILDPGAVFAGWVGLGMALVIAIAFELIVAVQALVFLVAPLAGALIGAYANQRAGRWRPRRRVLANAAYAGSVTGLGLAALYVALRLLFVYFDSGYRPEPMGGQLECATGPECTWQRLVEEGHETALLEAGIRDAASFEAAMLREQLEGGAWMVGLTVAGALAAGAVRAARPPRAEEPAAGAAGAAAG